MKLHTLLQIEPEQHQVYLVCLAENRGPPGSSAFQNQQLTVHTLLLAADRQHDVECQMRH